MGALRTAAVLPACASSRIGTDWTSSRIGTIAPMLLKVTFSEEEMAAVDALRGSRPRATWVRGAVRVAVVAAGVSEESRLPERPGRGLRIIRSPAEQRRVDAVLAEAGDQTSDRPARKVLGFRPA